MVRLGTSALFAIAIVGSGADDGMAEELADGTPSAGKGTRMPIVRELIVAADYGQIYICDPQTQEVPNPTDDEDDNVALRALDDAYGSRRFVGYDGGFVDVITPSQYNWKAPLRLEVHAAPPPLDADDWDHIVEVPLPAPSGMLLFQASGDGPRTEVMVPPAIYRARISGRNYVLAPDAIEGGETYRVQLWPASESPAELVKYWPGWDPVPSE